MSARATFSTPRRGSAFGPAPAGRPAGFARRGLGFVSAFGVAALACWRVSHLIASEDGPFDVVVRARARAGTSVLGRLMDCPLCVSVWTGAPLAAWAVHRGGGRRADVIPVWLAVSGAASALELALPSKEQSLTEEAEPFAGPAAVSDPPSSIPGRPHLYLAR